MSKNTTNQHNSPKDQQYLEENIPGITEIYDKFLRSYQGRKRERAKVCVVAYAAWKYAHREVVEEKHPKYLDIKEMLEGNANSVQAFCKNLAYNSMKNVGITDRSGELFVKLCVEFDEIMERLLHMLKQQEATKMTDEQKVEVGTRLLRDLSKEYKFANDFTDEHVKNTGESRDDIAYSCWSYASVEATGLTPEQARGCIQAALIDLEKNYAFKPKKVEV